ncbi:MAG: ArsR/SmtB family transcription factor [Pseudomonadales bacterium]
MPSRVAVAKELSGLLKVMAHPDRIQIVQLLAVRGEHNVGSIAANLGLPAPRVSQHLAALKSLRLVEETPRAQERIYKLASNYLATWLVEGVRFIAPSLGTVTDEQLADARRLWLGAFAPEIH